MKTLTYWVSPTIWHTAEVTSRKEYDLRFWQTLAGLTILPEIAKAAEGQTDVDAPGNLDFWPSDFARVPEPKPTYDDRYERFRNNPKTMPLDPNRFLPSDFKGVAPFSEFTLGSARYAIAAAWPRHGSADLHMRGFPLHECGIDYVLPCYVSENHLLHVFAPVATAPGRGGHLTNTGIALGSSSTGIALGCCNPLDSLLDLPTVSTGAAEATDKARRGEGSRVL